MEKERRFSVLAMVKLALEEKRQEGALDCSVKDIVRLACEYGGRFKVSEGEVMQVLTTPLIKLFELED